MRTRHVGKPLREPQGRGPTTCVLVGADLAAVARAAQDRVRHDDRTARRGAARSSRTDSTPVETSPGSGPSGTGSGRVRLRDVVRAEMAVPQASGRRDDRADAVDEEAVRGLDRVHRDHAGECAASGGELRREPVDGRDGRHRGRRAADRPRRAASGTPAPSTMQSVSRMPNADRSARTGPRCERAAASRTVHASWATVSTRPAEGSSSPTSE